MYIVASFEQSLHLEMAIAKLEQEGLARDKILAIPLSRVKKEQLLFDTIHRSDGTSLLDGATILGTILMLFGVIYGFVLTWGPIFWGLIGLFTGAAIGFSLEYYLNKKNRKQDKKSYLTTEVVLIINCQPGQADTAVNVLWNHMANGIGRLDITSR